MYSTVEYSSKGHRHRLVIGVHADNSKNPHQFVFLSKVIVIVSSHES
jgi:hypothetical protein